MNYPYQLIFCQEEREGTRIPPTSKEVGFLLIFMSSKGIDQLAERLSLMEAAHQKLRLERQRWRRFGFLGMLGIGVAVGMGAAKSWPSIQAREFILRDAEGRVRASLSLRPDGTPGLALFNESGQPRLSLDLSTDDQPGVNLHDEDGTLRAALAIRPDGTPGMGLFGSDRKPRVSLDLGLNQTAGFHLFDEAGALRGALAIRPDGSPGLGLFDERGEPGQSLELPVEAVASPATEEQPVPQS